MPNYCRVRVRAGEILCYNDKQRPSATANLSLRPEKFHSP